MALSHQLWGAIIHSSNDATYPTGKKKTSDHVIFIQLIKRGTKNHVASINQWKAGRYL